MQPLDLGARPGCHQSHVSGWWLTLWHSGTDYREQEQAWHWRPTPWPPVGLQRLGVGLLSPASPWGGDKGRDLQFRNPNAFKTESLSNLIWWQSLTGTIKVTSLRFTVETLMCRQRGHTHWARSYTSICTLSKIKEVLEFSGANR